MHYFDYAAATPLSPTVQKAMEPYFVEQFYNPSAQYLAAQKVRKAVEQARADVAGVLGVRAREIIFTAGGTEADNLAICGIMQLFPGANCIISAVEHDAVLEPAARFDYTIAPVDAQGVVDVAALKQLIDDKTVLISVMYVNNEIGTVQPLSTVTKLVKEIRWQRAKTGNKLPLYVHTDACQAPNYLQVLPNTLGVDMMTLNGGKIYGPKQSGALFVKSGIALAPIIYGGGQEHGLRSGTENVPAVVGFAAALVETAQMRETEWLRMTQVKAAGYEYLEKHLPSATVNGSLKHRIPNNLHLTFPGQDNERLMMALDEQGFMVAVGSACSASSDEPSHVLKAIGMSDKDAQSSLRITMGRSTTEADLVALLSALKNLI